MVKQQLFVINIESLAGKRQSIEKKNIPVFVSTKTNFLYLIQPFPKPEETASLSKHSINSQKMSNDSNQNYWCKIY